MDDLLDTLKKFQRTYHQYVKADERLCASERPKQHLDSMTAEDYWWNETRDNQVISLKENLKKSDFDYRLAQNDLQETTKTIQSTKESLCAVADRINTHQNDLIKYRKHMIDQRIINAVAIVAVVMFVLSWLIFKLNILVSILITACISVAVYYCILKPFKNIKYNSLNKDCRDAITEKTKELYIQYQKDYPSSSSIIECGDFLKRISSDFFSLRTNSPMDAVVSNAAQAQAAILRSITLAEESAAENTAQAQQLIAACTEAKQQAEEQMNTAFRERGADLLNTARAEATATYEQDRATCLELRKQLRSYNVIPSEKDWPNVDLIIDFIQSGRAGTLAEALNLCDELSHRESLRQAEAKRLRDQERFHEEQRIRMAELEEEQAREAARNEARHQERLVQEQLNHEEMLRVQEQTRNAQIAAAAAQAAALFQNRQANKNR